LPTAAANNNHIETIHVVVHYRNIGSHHHLSFAHFNVGQEIVVPKIVEFLLMMRR
jgi:hypothetical protein